MNKVFTRRVSIQARIMFVLIILPLYMYCGSLILSALLKFILVQLSLQIDYVSANTYLNFVMDFIMLIIVFFIIKDEILEQWKDYFKSLKSNLIYGCLVGPATIYGLSILGGLITLAFGGNQLSENQELINIMTQSKPILMIITTVILAPILEEFVFRGIVFGWLYEYNRYVAHIVTALLFAFVHVMMAIFSGNVSEWVQIFVYLFMAFPLSYLYEKSNNIFVPISTHMINNFISIVLLILGNG